MQDLGCPLLYNPAEELNMHNPRGLRVRHSAPCGLKSILMCLSRATVLAEPEDTLEFLTSHAQRMLESRSDNSRDTDEAVFQYQVEWEKTSLPDIWEKMNSGSRPVSSPPPAPPPSPLTPPTSPPPPALLRSKLPCEENVKPWQFRGFKKKKKPLPSISQKASAKNVKKEQKPTNRFCLGDFICRLNDCPYHKHIEEPKSTETAKTVKTRKAAIDPWLIYRAPSGYILDPELRRTRSTRT